MKEFLIITLLAVSVYFFQEAGKVVNKQKQIKTIPATVEMQKRVTPEMIEAWQTPLLVKPNRFYKRAEEDLTPLLVRPKKSYKAKAIKKEIKKEIQ